MARRAPANAHARTVVDYGVDPRGRSIIAGLTSEIGSRLAGHGGAIFVGDKGDPNQRYDGYAAAQQHFTGAAAGHGTPSRFRDTQARTIESSLPDNNVGGDPARRMFADRLRRRNA